jgi:hypothetical protein
MRPARRCERLAVMNSKAGVAGYWANAMDAFEDISRLYSVGYSCEAHQ